MNDENPELIRSAQLGDMSAFRKIIELYSSRVHSIAFHVTGNSMDAQDVAQEVFIRLYNSLKKYDERYNFMVWIYRMTVNISIDYRRKNKRRCHISMDNILENNPVGNTHSQSGPPEGWNELKGAVVRLTKILSVKQKKVFVLRDLQDFSIYEIAEILNCSPVTVRVHLARARQRIRNALLREFPELCSGEKQEEERTR